MIDYYEPNLDLTLLGCGFLGTYHLGAIYLLSQIWPQKPYNRICGASCGGLVAAILLAGMKLDQVLDNALDIIRHLRRSIKKLSYLSLGECDTIGELVERKLEKILPENAHVLCSDRLGISVTKLWTFENEVVNKFRTRRDLIDAICAGCFIPLWSGSLKPPTVGARACIDGAYSNNSPKFPLTPGDSKISQILISPFASEVDVSPQGERYLFKSRVSGTLYLCTWNNVIRTFHAMFPFGLDKYKTHMIEGHRDMKHYLIRNNLILCRECWSGRAENTVIPRSCLTCLKLLEQVDSLKLPDKTLRIFEE